MTPSYFSFLIRIWKAPASKPPYWHASLEVPATHETVYFHSVKDCLDYLQQLEKDEEKNLLSGIDSADEITDL